MPAPLALALAALLAAPQPAGSPRFVYPAAHPGRVNALAMSPDGTLVASGDEQGRILLWDVPTRFLRGSLSLPGIWLSALALDPQDRTLAALAGGEITLFDLATASVRATLKPAGGAQALAFSQDGSRLLVAAGDALELYDPARGVRLERRPAPGPVEAVAFGPGGRLAAAGDQGQVWIWEAAGAPPVALPAREGAAQRVGSLAWSRDGRYLAAAGWEPEYEGDGSLWDARAHRLCARLGRTGSVAFTAEGALLALSKEQLQRVPLQGRLGPAGCPDEPVELDTLLGDNGGSLRVVQGLGDDYLHRPLATDAAGAVVAVVNEAGALSLWRPAVALDHGAPGTLSFADSPGVAVRYSPDGSRLYVGSHHDLALVLDARDRHVLARLIATPACYSTDPLHQAPKGCEVGELALSGDGRTLALSTGQGQVVLWDTGSLRERRRLDAHAGRLQDLALSADGARVATAGGEDHRFRVFDAGSGQRLAELPWEVHYAIGVAFSPDGRLLATAGDEAVRIWDTARWAPVATLPLANVGRVEFSPDGRLLAAAGPDGVRLYDAALWKLARLLPGAPVRALRFDRAGARLAFTAQDYSAQLFEVASGQPLARYPVDYETTSLDFSPDGSRLATMPWYGTPSLWDTRQGASLGRLGERPEGVKQVSWSAAGLATLSPEGLFQQWDARGGAIQLQRRLHHEGYGDHAPWGSAALRSDGQQLAYTSPSGYGAYTLDLASQAVRVYGDPHNDQVESVFYLGPNLLAGLSYGILRRWDATTGAALPAVRLPKPAHEVPPGAPSLSGDPVGYTVAVRPDGAALALPNGERFRCDRLSDGSPLCTVEAHYVEVVDPGSGARLQRLELRNTARQLAYDPSGQVLALSQDSGEIDLVRGGAMQVIRPADAQAGCALAFSPDGQSLAAACGPRFELYDLQTGQRRLQRDLPAPVAAPAFSPDGRFVALAAGELVLLRLADGATLWLRSEEVEGHPAVLALGEDGAYDGDLALAERYPFRIGPDLGRGEVVSADQLFEAFHRANLLAAFLAGKPVAATAGAVGLPPRVVPSELPSGLASGRKVALRFAVEDRGGGIGEVRVFHNRTRIDPEEGFAGRGFKVHREARCQGGEGRVCAELEVDLDPGDNELVIEAYGQLGRVRSQRVRSLVTWPERAARPDLHLVALSLDRYEAEGMQLNYANTDAQAVIAAFKAQEGRLFEKVRVYPLRDGEATRERAQQVLAQVAKAARPEDVFVFYAAGHGTMVSCGPAPAPALGEDLPLPEGEYYLLTYRADLRSEKTICAEGLGDKELGRLLRQIPARKKLALLDTCQAGGAARMAVAMRGAQEVEALQRLVRAEGTAVIAAASSLELAGEVPELGHGIFTYALLQGLAGQAKAKGRDMVTVGSLIDYMEDAVPALSRRYRQRTQRPIKDNYGSDFPLAVP